MLRDGAPGALQGAEAEAEGLCSIPLPAQPTAAVVRASPAGSTVVALAQHPGVRLVPLVVPASSQAHRAQQVCCEALW